MPALRPVRTLNVTSSVAYRSLAHLLHRTESSTVTEKIEVCVTALVAETDAIRRLEFRPIAGPLPAFSAGAHIDLHLPVGLSRSYSLLNSQDERHRYVIGVSLEPRWFSLHP